MGVVDRWLDFRDRCLTSDRFHQFAAAFPFTRPVVRKRQSELFDLVSGFVYSQILLACVELDVLGHIGSGLSVEALSKKIDLGVDETRRLAEGAATLRLLQARGDIYRLGDLGAALLANPGAQAMVRHHPALYQDLTDPAAFLRAGRGDTHLSRFWDYAGSHDEEMGADRSQIYSQLMATSQTMVAREVLARYDFKRHDKLLDMGGGHGAFVSAVAAQAPALHLALFDLPAVAAQARAALAGQGLAERVVVHPGSFFDDPVPRGADVITLVRILHDHDDGPAQAILKAAFEALPAGGTLLVCEPMSTGGYAARLTQAYFNFYLYAMGSGRPRTPQRLTEMLKTAGFVGVRPIKTRSPFITSMLVSTKNR